MTKKHILIIDDSSEVREVLTINLTSANFEIAQASDGRDAFNILSSQTWFCIISDIQMPNINGIEFIKIIRSQGLKFPVIFITGFEHVLEVKEAFNLGAQAFLTKPFKEGDLLEKLNEIENYNNFINRPEAEIVLEDHFGRIPIDEFVTGKKIVYPIYLKLSESKFVKIAHTGEDLSLNKIEHLKKNGVSFFYLENTDFRNYISRNIKMAKNLLQFKDIKDAKKQAFFLSITKNLVQLEFNREINEETLSMSVYAIHNTLKLVSEKNDFYQALQSLNNISNSIVEHSVLVSLIASAIALESGHFNHKTINNVSIAALFHDIGLKELSKNIISKDKKSLTAEERKLYQSHTQLGCQILSAIKNIPEIIPQAILHHHENCDGSGFPFSIGKAKLNSISRIIRIADEITHEWIHHSIENKINTSFRTIVNNYRNSDQLDKDYLRATIRLFSSSDPLLKINF